MDGGATVEVLHAIVRGRVQGVGFRYYVRERARSLRLAGWVRNLPDGAVEVLARGERDAVERLRTAIRAGPPGARVTTVDPVTSQPVDEPHEPFGIIR
jgi:acylphosphatase